ncbi:MAG: hypothetical protein AAF065_12795 [Verrucomicrobiota bacterium]
MMIIHGIDESVTDKALCLGSGKKQIKSMAVPIQSNFEARFNFTGFKEAITCVIIEGFAPQHSP